MTWQAAVGSHQTQRKKDDRSRSEVSVDAGLGRGCQVPGSRDNLWLTYSNQDEHEDHPGVPSTSYYTCTFSRVRKRHGARSAPTVRPMTAESKILSHHPEALWPPGLLPIHPVGRTRRTRFAEELKGSLAPPPDPCGSVSLRRLLGPVRWLSWYES